MSSEIEDNQISAESSVLLDEQTDAQGLSADNAPAEAEVAAKQHLKATVIKAYKTNQDRTISDEQIVEYLPMVSRIVNKVVSYMSGPLSKEDLVSAGTIGLVKAARDYDCSKEANFKTYAYIRVRGAVIDELRSWSFTPSDVSKRIEQARQLTIELTDAAGTMPSDEEIAEKMGISVEKLYKTYEGARGQHFLSIHGVSEMAPALGSSLFDENVEMPGERIEKQELLEQLSKSILELPEKARRIIVLYYHQDLTMKEIAQVLGITESRVSQIHASAVFKLSVKMSQYDDTRQN